MVGVPMLKAERISRSGPKLSDAQIRNFEAIKYTHFATVFLLARSLRAISALGTPSASVARMSFMVSRGRVISSVLPGRARQSLRPGKP